MSSTSSSSSSTVFQSIPALNWSNLLDKELLDRIGNDPLLLLNDNILSHIANSDSTSSNSTPPSLPPPIMVMTQDSKGKKFMALPTTGYTSSTPSEYMKAMECDNELEFLEVSSFFSFLYS